MAKIKKKKKRTTSVFFSIGMAPMIDDTILFRP